MQINRERLVQSFFALTAIDSPSLGERAMADELKRRLLALGFAVREDDAGARIGGSSGNVFAELRGGGTLPPLLLCAHMDTVQPALNKRAVLESDGTIRSAGDTVLGADDVSAISAILEAVQTLLEHNALQRDVEVLFTVSEETYGSGAAAFDCSVIRSKEAYVPDFDGVHGQAVVAAPTILTFRAEIAGKASHAGFAPEQGVSAISAAARAIDSLRLGRITDDLTRNIGTIHGGLLTNIVPETCAVEGEIRGSVHAEALDCLTQTERAFQTACDAFGAALTFSSKCLITAYHTPEDAPVVRRYFRACETFGLKTETVRTFGGSDNNILAQRGISGIVIPSAMHACHSSEEYTSVQELERLAELLAELLCLQREPPSRSTMRKTLQERTGQSMDENTNRIYTEILRSELKTALGCTEPIAIAYCVAYAKNILGKTPDQCDLYCTGSMIKNASAVTVPQTGGLRGIEAAALAGLFGGNAAKELEVLSDIGDDDRKQIQAAMGTGLVRVHLQEYEVALRIEAVLRAGEDTASAEVIHTHTGLGTVHLNGVVLSQRSKESAEEDEIKFKSLNIRDILAYADTVELSQVEELLRRQIRHNSQIAGEGLQRDWGVRVGKTILAQSGSGLRAKAIAMAAAGSDARMNGCALPVVINGGSGNQGLTVSLPVLAYAEAKGASEERLLRALCVSNLVSLRQKAEIGRLSAYCGVVCAATGAITGIGYLNGDSYEVIAQSIVNSIGCIGGMVCDGAKSSCADKIAVALQCAFLGYDLACAGAGFQNGEGIVKDGVEETIDSVGRMARRGMQETNREILEIMMD